MKFAYAALAGVILLFTGCETPETMVATGGSRADGTVNLSYEYGMFQKPIVDKASAQVTAAQKCQAWGYSDAEAFGGAMSHCEERNEYGCIRTLVSVTYQCTGAGPPH